MSNSALLNYIEGLTSGEDKDSLVGRSSSIGGAYIGRRAVVDALQGKTISRQRWLDGLFALQSPLQYCTILEPALGQNMDVGELSSENSLAESSEGSDAVEKGGVTVDNLMSPSEIDAYVDISRRSYLSPVKHPIIVSNLLKAWSDRVGRIVTSGSGTGNQPRGIRNVAGRKILADVTKANLARGTTDSLFTLIDEGKIPVSWSEMVDGMERTFYRRGWAMGVKAYGLLRKEPRFKDSTGNALGSRTVLDSLEGEDFVLRTHHLDTVVAGADNDKSDIIYGYWPDVAVAIWGDVEIWTDGISRAGKVRVHIFGDYDVKTLRETAFATTSVTGL